MAFTPIQDETTGNPMSSDHFQPLSHEDSQALLGASNAANERLMAAQKDSTDAQQQSAELNSAGGKTAGFFEALPQSTWDVAKGAVKGALNPNTYLNAIKSAARSPVDIVRGLFGKQPELNQAERENPQLRTVQQKFMTDTIPAVESGQMSPLAGTMEGVGGAVNAGLTLGMLGESPGLAKGGLSSARTVTSGLIDNVPKAIQTAKNVVSEIAHPLRGAEGNQIIKTIEHLKGDVSTMSKADRTQAILSGRMEKPIFGSKEIAPSDTEVNAATLLKGKTTGNPVKDLSLVQNEIKTRGADAEKYLADNAKPITNKEHYDMFATRRAAAEKVLTEPQLKAYDDQVKLFSKQLPGRGSYDTSTYYKALKDYEENVASKLPKGKEALIDPTGVANANVRGASDVRSVVRDMIGSKNPDFKPKMFDLASLYDVRGNLVTATDKLPIKASERFAQNHPLITKAAKLGGGAAVVGTVGKKAFDLTQ